MTLAISTRYKLYQVVVLTDTFLVPFPLFSPDDIAVYVDGVITTQFSLTATFTNGRADDASVKLNVEVVDVDVEIYGRRLARRQDDYLGNTPQLAEKLQRDMDALAAVQQEQERDFNRSIKLPVEVGVNYDLGVYSNDRKGKLIGFDAANGSPIVVEGAIDSVLVSAPMANVVSAGTLDLAMQELFGGGLKLKDGFKALFGDTQDGEIFFDGTEFVFRAKSGGSVHHTPSIRFKGLGGQVLLSAFENGGCILYTKGAERLKTFEDRVEVYGNLDVSGSVNAAPVVVLEDQKPDGTASGTATSGQDETRELNTIVRNQGGIVSLANNEMSLSADVWCEWESPAYKCGTHQTWIYNVTDAAVVAYGSAGASNVTNATQSESKGGAALAAGKTYKIIQRVATTRAPNGNGIAANFGGTNVFTRVTMWRL